MALPPTIKILILTDIHVRITNCELELSEALIRLKLDKLTIKHLPLRAIDFLDFVKKKRISPKKLKMPLEAIS